MKSILVKLPNWIGDILFSYDLLFSLSQNVDRLVLLTSQEHSELFQIFPISNAYVVTYATTEWPWLKRSTRSKINELRIDAGLLLPIRSDQHWRFDVLEFGISMDTARNIAHSC